MKEQVSREEIREMLNQANKRDSYCCYTSEYDFPRLAESYLALLDECEDLRRDKERLDWCEENIDDVTVLRDIQRGVKWEITYCADESGCQVENKEPTFREAID